MSSQPANLIPFAVPPHSQSISLAQARLNLPPEQFRQRLRSHLLDHPGLTLAQVAAQINVSRQRAAQLAGRLGRPNYARPNRPAPKKDQAKKKLVQLAERVAQGEPATRAAAALDLSLPQVYRLGFKARAVRPVPHGRGRQDCNCWRCRRAAGVAIPHGPRFSSSQRAQIIDLLAWIDPDDQSPLTQAAIGKLANVRQGAVSRIARAIEK